MIRFVFKKIFHITYMQTAITLFYISFIELWYMARTLRKNFGWKTDNFTNSSQKHWQDETAKKLGWNL